MSHRKNPIPTPVSLSQGERGWGEGSTPGDYRIATGFTGEPVPPVTRNGLTVSMNS